MSETLEDYQKRAYQISWVELWNDRMTEYNRNPQNQENVRDMIDMLQRRLDDPKWK